MTALGGSGGNDVVFHPSCYLSFQSHIAACTAHVASAPRCAWRVHRAGHSDRWCLPGRAHFRRLPDGRLIWARPHQRGLAHELYVPSVRKVG